MTAIAVDSSNASHIVYNDYVKSGGSYYNTVMYIDNVGTSSWNSKVTVYGASTRQSGLMGDILVNQNNVPEISLQAGASLGAAIGNANKATSFTIQTLSISLSVIQQPSIVMDSSNNTWIAYLVGPDTSWVPAIVEHKASDAWSTWQTPVQDSSVVVYAGFPINVALAASGSTLYVAYPSGISPYNVMWQGYNGSSWSSAISFGEPSLTPILRWSEWFNNGGGNQIDVLMSGSAGAYWNQITSSIFSISPTSGAIGTPVTINGAGFGSSQGASTVTFNGVAATPTSWSTNSIVVPVPAGASTGPVVVTAGGTPSNSVNFTVPPSISSLSPPMGPVGTVVTVTGQAFGATQGSSTVSFGGVNAIVSNWSSSSISATVPLTLNSGPGAYNVVVTVNGAASNSATFAVTPAISGISPAGGPVGTMVNISGSNFGSTMGAVTFNGVAASPNTWTNGFIQVPVPSGSSSGAVVVTSGGYSSNAASFTVPVNVASISPASGTAGTVVTISGQNFGPSQASSAVTFNGLRAPPTSWNDTSITVPAPAGVTTGLVQVTVGGSTSNGLLFTASPAMTAISPTSGPVGTTVAITGSNFGSQGPGGVVSFNGTNAAVSNWTSTRVVASVPSAASTGPVVVTVGALTSNGITFTVGAGTLSGIVSKASDGTPITGASVQALQNNAVFSSTTTAGDGSYSLANLAPGTYDLRVSASGLGTALQAGNSVAAGGTTTVNISLTAAGTLSGQVTQSDGVTTIMGATVSVNQGADGVATTTTDLSGSYSISNLSAGTYGAQASAIGFSAQTQSGITITADNTTTQNFALPGQHVITYTHDELGRLVGTADSLGDVVAYQYDAVGNLLSIARSQSSQVFIVDFTPKTGPAGTTVTISGTGFTTTPSQNSVSFNGTAATVVSSTATQITATVPAGATTGPITVTAPAGTATSSASYTVGATDAPTISSFSPTIGPAGTALTITGTNFDPTATNDHVKLNDSSVSLSSATSTTLAATVPTSTSSGHIAVHTASGQVVTSDYFFIPPSPYTASNVAYTGTISFGNSTNVTISTAGQIALLVFDATAGQLINVSPTNNGFTSGCGAGLSVVNPNGSTLASSYTGCSGGIFNKTLPQTGTYTVLLTSGSYTGSVTLTLTADQAGTISFNTPETASNTLPGQTIALTLSGAERQLINLSPTNNNYTNSCGAGLSIVNPNGSTLASSNTGCNGGIFNRALSSSGTYTVLISPGNYTGSATLTLTQDQTGTIAFDTPAMVSNTLPGQTIELTFGGTAGELINLSPTANSYTSGCGAGLSVVNPDGSTLATSYTGCSGGICDKALPTTGTYTLIISPGNYTGSATLTLSQTQTGTITPNGSPVTVNFTEPGQTARLTWSGTAGQTVSVQTVGGTLTSCQVGVSILNPDGTTLKSNSCIGNNGFIDEATLTQTGTYTLYVYAGANTGSVTVQLWGFTDISGTIMPSGSPVNVNLTTPGQKARLTWSGTAGQTVSVQNAGGSFTGCQVGISILNPDGTTLRTNGCMGTGSGYGFLDEQTLTQTGTYTLYVYAGANTGSITVQLWGFADVSETITPSGSPVSVNLTTPGQKARLTWSGTAGQTVSVQNAGGSFTGCQVGISILNPDGTTLRTNGCMGTGSGYGFLDEQTLTQTGTYTLYVYAGANTGSITVQLWGFTDISGTIAPNGSGVNVSLTTPGQKARLTWSGNNGDQVSVHSSNSTFASCSVGVSILNPNGSTLRSNSCMGTNGSVLGSVTLGTTGTFTLYIYAGANTGSLTVTLTSP